MAKEGSKIILIRDIGAVAEQGDRDDELWVINNVTVAGVPYFDMYKLCLQSKVRVEPYTERLGKFEDGLHDDVVFVHNTLLPNSCFCMTMMDNRERRLHLSMGRRFTRLLVVTMFQLRD